MTGSLTEQIRCAWDRVLERFAADRYPLVRTTASVAPADIETDWVACLTVVQELFSTYYGSVAVEEWFRVPEDYAAFMQTVGGGWKCQHGLEWSVFAAATVAGATANDFKLLVVGESEDEPVLDWSRIRRVPAHGRFAFCLAEDAREAGRTKRCT